MTSPRIIVSGATTAITRRTTLRKAFLGPWDPLVQQCWLYALADAQRHTDVAIHHGVLVVNHEHLVVTPTHDNLPEFVRRVHRDVSCAINTLLANQRYDAPRELFDGRVAHYQRLCDDGAQALRLLYDHVNCVAAGLVERPEHMPGHVFNFDLWRHGYLDVQRPPVYFGDNDRARPQVIRMHVTPPPLLYEAFGGDVERLTYYLNRLREISIQRIRSLRAKPALGARSVQRLHPWSEPRSLRETGARRVPSFSIRANGPFTREQSIRAAVEVRSFRRTYQQVRIAHRAGNRRPRYPFGAYAVRTVHNAPIEAEPSPDAIVGQPGPLLCDIDARLRENWAERSTRERSLRLIEELRAALNDDTESRVEAAAMDFATERASDQGPRDAITRHRFEAHAPREPALEAGPDAARRLIVLRDRRMGRPPKAKAQHGADPPG